MRGVRTSHSSMPSDIFDPDSDLRDSFDVTTDKKDYKASIFIQRDVPRKSQESF